MTKFIERLEEVEQKQAQVIDGVTKLASTLKDLNNAKNINKSEW